MPPLAPVTTWLAAVALGGLALIAALGAGWALGHRGLGRERLALADAIRRALGDPSDLSRRLRVVSGPEGATPSDFPVPRWYFDSDGDWLGWDFAPLYDPGAAAACYARPSPGCGPLAAAFELLAVAPPIELWPDYVGREPWPGDSDRNWKALYLEARDRWDRDGMALVREGSAHEETMRRLRESREREAAQRACSNRAYFEACDALARALAGGDFAADPAGAMDRAFDWIRTARTAREAERGGHAATA